MRAGPFKPSLRSMYMMSARMIALRVEELGAGHGAHLGEALDLCVAQAAGLPVPAGRLQREPAALGPAIEERHLEPEVGGASATDPMLTCERPKLCEFGAVEP